MRVGDMEVSTPLKTLRTVLGDVRVEALQDQAAGLRWKGDYSAEELLCLAEFLRLAAEAQSEGEARGVGEGKGIG